MSLRHGWEPMRTLLDEPNLGDLLRGHWLELAVHQDQMPLDPNFQRFVEMDDAGLFKVWTARDGATLVGYLAFYIMPHAHYKSTLTAVEDLFLLSPDYRKGMAGLRMFTSAFDALKALGVKRVICHSKTAFQADRGGLDRFFEHMGFEFTDKLWSKML